MQARNRVFVAFFILVFLIVGLYIFSDWFSKTTGYVLGEDEKMKLAQCLTGEGAMLYFSEDCYECDLQIEIFGNAAYDFVNSFTCISEEECPAIEGFPAWQIKGKLYYGKKELSELIEISGCVVE